MDKKLSRSPDPRLSGTAVAGQALDILVAPCSPERFFADYWRRRPLYVSASNGSAALFESLLPLVDIDRVFTASSGSVEDWFFFRSGENLVRENFVGAQNQVQLNHIYALYREGGTIQLRNVQRYLPAIERFSCGMTRRFRCKVAVNLWVTRDNDFTPFLHFDTHDSFILQLHGRKQWTLYEHQSALFAPRAQDVSLNRNDVGEPVQNLSIGAGDMLYVPAGTPHEVVTLDPHSIHLAIGVFPLLWRDVADAAIADLDARGSVLSEAVPLDLLLGQPKALKAALRGYLKQAVDEVHREAFVAHLQQRIIDAMPPPVDGHFLREILGRADADDASDPAAVQADTLVRRRADAPTVVQVDTRGDHALLSFPGGGEMKAPAALADTLRAIGAAATSFSAKSLPPDFDLTSRVLLLDELLQRGLLERGG